MKRNVFLSNIVSLILGSAADAAAGRRGGWRANTPASDSLFWKGRRRRRKKSEQRRKSFPPHFPFAYKYTKGRCGDGGGWIFKLGEKGKEEEEEEEGGGKISYYAVAMLGHREKIFVKNNL